MPHSGGHPGQGTPASRDQLGKLRDYSELFEIGTRTEQALSEPAKLAVLEQGKAILHDLERLFRDEALELVKIDATYFVGRLLEAVHRLLPLVSDSLHLRLECDLPFREEIAVWAVKQGIAGDPRDLEFARSIARQIVYRLLGKVLFYQSLRRSARQLPDLDFRGVDSSQVLPGLRAAFGRALEIDYHAVFAEDVPDRVQWPADASRELAALVRDFHTRDFSHVPQDVIGTVFEQLIPPEERHGLGQYFTPENVCDLILGFCIQSANDYVLDPTCGTGTFLLRAYDRLQTLGRRDHVALLSQLWGIDIAPFPAELATINLFRQRVAEHGNFPRIICKDFFSLSPGDRFPFPPPKMDLRRPEMIEEEIPQFDAVVGNFPYVSQDQIERRESGYREVLRKRLLEDWFTDYPELFYYKNRQTQAEFEKLIDRGAHKDCQREQAEHRISTYADLYVHLFFHATRFLKPGGRMGIVTSNAWLDVNYGYELQKFLLHHFKVIAILESRCEPWFVEASLNTVVTIVERCESAKERDANLVRLVKVKRRLAELIPENPLTEALPRWQHLKKLTGIIERAGTKYGKTHPLGLVTEEDDEFRIRIQRQGEMRDELELEEKTVKWGKFLRAPQIHFDILHNGKLCLLRKIAMPLRGGMTRINEFFHVSPEVAERFGIEEEYLIPLIKSPKETSTINVNADELQLRIFACRHPISELEERGHKGALKYIQWGEQQRWPDGSLWKDGTWVRERVPGWWALPKSEITMGQMFFAHGYGDRYIQRYCGTPVVVDHNLYYLSPAEGMTNEILAALLNCSVTAMLAENAGRLLMGDGVLKLMVEEARDYLAVPDLRVLPHASTKKILKLFDSLASREILDVFNEVKQPDRKAFDSAVLEAIGLSPRKYLKPLYEGWCDLVRERIELGKTRGKVRKTRSRTVRAEKQVAEAVLDKILPDGPKRFPEEFFSVAATQDKRTEIQLPAADLHFDNMPMNMEVHTDDESFSRNVKSPAEAKFLLYAQRAGQNVAELPEKPVEITRTVANYEKYLRELRQQLYEAYYRRTLDQAAAARLTQGAFERFRLPAVGA